jgi:hypothetical protein
VDNKTFKCYDLKIDALMHLGRIGKYLGKMDISQTSLMDADYRNKKGVDLVKILGLPAPSCFPKKFNEYVKAYSNPTQEKKADGQLLLDKKQEIVNRYLCKFLVKKHRPEFGFPSYENILQYICKHDQKNVLEAYCDNIDYFVFTRCPLSPMLLMQM